MQNTLSEVPEIWVPTDPLIEAPKCPVYLTLCSFKESIFPTPDSEVILQNLDTESSTKS